MWEVSEKYAAITLVVEAGNERWDRRARQYRTNIHFYPAKLHLLKKYKLKIGPKVVILCGKCGQQSKNMQRERQLWREGRREEVRKDGTEGKWPESRHSMWEVSKKNEKKKHAARTPGGEGGSEDSAQLGPPPAQLGSARVALGSRSARARLALGSARPGLAGSVRPGLRRNFY